MKNPKTKLHKCNYKIFKHLGKTIFHTTIKNTLNDNNVYAYTSINKPLFIKRHILLRREKTTKVLVLSDNDIKSIIFTDESKFNRFYSDGRVSVWRKAGTGLI